MRILHLYNWQLWAIKENLPAIKQQGFNAIQINPIQPLKEPGPGEWWLSYQPVGFTIGNYFGTKKDLEELCRDANDYGIRIIADVVCNHLASEPIQDSLNPHELVPEKYKKNADFWKPKKNVSNWESRYEVINYCMRLPGLNIQNEYVQQEIFSFLDELISCGVKGFRFDAAKSIGLPEEGVHFWDKIARKYNNDDFALYGEVIFSSPELIDAYSKYMKVLTNHYNGRNPENVIIFAESHDSFFDEGFGRYSSKWCDEEVARMYNEVCESYDHTLKFARPNNDNSWKNEAIKVANLKRNKVYVR